MILDPEQLAVATKSKVSDVQKFTPYLESLLDEFEIDTPLRMSHFFAQVAHESDHFTKTEENLYYRAETLLRLFPYTERRKWGFVDKRDADNYAMQPVMIASRIYGNRMGNGPEETGEGWTHRGRGLIQLTGKDNQTRYWEQASEEEGPLDPDRLAEPYHACRSACWFWKVNGINTYADLDSNTLVTERVNGGRIGLDDRAQLLARMQTLYRLA